VNDGRAAAFVRTLVPTICISTDTSLPRCGSTSRTSPRSLLSSQADLVLIQRSKPFLNETRFIDHVLTPWSSWLIVASPTLISTRRSILTSFLSNLSASIAAFDAPSARLTTSKAFVINHFGYPEVDVQAWLGTVRYPLDGVDKVAKGLVVETLGVLEKAGVVSMPEGGWNVEAFVETSMVTLV
jgi:hypothetical protein